MFLLKMLLLAPTFPSLEHYISELLISRIFVVLLALHLDDLCNLVFCANEADN